MTNDNPSSWRERKAILGYVLAQTKGLRGMLLGSCALMVVQALWTGVVVSGLGAFLQVAFASLQGTSVALDKAPSLVRPLARLFLSWPEGSRLYASFGLMGMMFLGSSVLKVVCFAYQTRFSTQFTFRFRQKVFAALCQNAIGFFDTHKRARSCR